MAEEAIKKPKTTKKMKRPVQPGMLLIHVLEYTKENDIKPSDTIQDMIDALRDDIVAEDLAKRAG